jgi:hypothetical protein
MNVYPSRGLYEYLLERSSKGDQEATTAETLYAVIVRRNRQIDNHLVPLPTQFHETAERLGQTAPLLTVPFYK